MPRGGDLAAEHRQQRRAVCVEFQHIVAGHRLGFARPVIIERTDPGIGRDDVSWADLPGEIAIGGRAEIVDLSRCDDRIFGPLHGFVGRADQSLGALVGDREDDAPVGLLEHIGLVAGEQRVNNDMAALDQTDRRRAVDPRLGEQLCHPRPSGIDHRLGSDSGAVGQFGLPLAIQPPRRDKPGLCPHFCAVKRCVHCIENNQPRIIDPRVGIDKALGLLFQRSAERTVIGSQPARARQADPPANRVVKPQPEPDQPPGPHRILVGQDEQHRVDQMRRGAQQPLAFLQRLPHQPEFIIFEVTQATVDQLC